MHLLENEWLLSLIGLVNLPFHNAQISNLKLQLIYQSTCLDFLKLTNDEIKFEHIVTFFMHEYTMGLPWKMNW
jgi:hypothetical protein